MQFTNLNIRSLFGYEDAESEDPSRFKEYFLKNGAYDDLVAPLPFHIVVGHKGVGKSALLRRAYLDDIENNMLAVEIQPNDISELMESIPSESFIQKIERWKGGIKRIVARKAIDSLVDDGFEKISNAGVAKVGKKITDFLYQTLTNFQPNISDNVAKAVSDNFLKNRTVRVYIDDIDRGWSASPADISNISALINACRDLCNSDRSFQCRIALRTDVYFLFRTADESTDKIEQNIIRLQWTNDEILRMISLRILTYFNEKRSEFDLNNLSQARISKEILAKVIEPIYHGRGNWEEVPVSVPLMSLCRKRPRDLVKLLHGSAKFASHNKNGIITNNDLTQAFENYSDERLQDLINEFKSELPNIENLLLRFKPTKSEKNLNQSFLFTTDELVKRIKNIRQQVPIRFNSNKPVTDQSVIVFLYKIDFLIARIDNGPKPKWTYFDQRRLLANDSIDFGYRWEIHPAYRWALQPNDLQTIIDSLGPEAPDAW